ncbi:MAG: SRPBCC family protein [Chloroflexota bacterium]|nr:SRPBCC family protein [Chloroflexota bacterium]
MPIIERHIRIEAPIGQVWDVLADVPGQPRWMRDLVRVRLVGDEPLAVGSRAIGDVEMFGFHQSDPIEVTALEPPTRYAIEHLGAFRGSGEFRLRSLDRERATHVWWREELRPTPDAVPGAGTIFGLPGLGLLLERLAGVGLRCIDPLFLPVFELVFRADLRRFKRLVETGQA